MTLPQYLAGWAVAFFMVAAITAAMRSHWQACRRMTEACGRVPTHTGHGSPPPRRDGGEPQAGPYNWAADGYGDAA